MTTPIDNTDVRDYILDNLDLVINDTEVIQALVDAQNKENAQDGDDSDNVIDLKQSLIKRLDKQLNQLTKKHKTILSVVQENVTTSRQIHRAMLSLLQPQNTVEFVKFVDEELAEMLNIDAARLCLEVGGFTKKFMETLQTKADGQFTFLPTGNVAHYIAGERGAQTRVCVLRALDNGHEKIYTDKAQEIRSEAALKLTLSDEKTAMLVLGAEDTAHFAPKMATDFLLFFAAIFEHVLDGHLKNGFLSR